MYSICGRKRIQIPLTTLFPHLQSANISYSMQKRLLFKDLISDFIFKIDYVCQITPGGGEGKPAHFWFLAGSLQEFKDSKLQMNFEIASASYVMTAMNVIIHNGLRNSLA